MRTPYTEFVRGLPCCVHGCTRRSDPHHVRTKGRQGQVDECNTVPLCPHHHTGGAGVHYLGQRTWARRFQVCLPAVALHVYLLWLNRSSSGWYTQDDLAF